MPIRIPLPPGFVTDAPRSIDITDVAAADAPVAIRCATTRGYRGQVVIGLRWYQDCLWGPCTPNQMEGYVDMIGKHVVDGEVDQALAGIRTLTQRHVAIDGALFERSTEPYWMIRAREDFERREQTPMLPTHTIEVQWGTFTGKTVEVRQCFRADRLHAAKRFAMRGWAMRDHDILDICEVLLPECLRLDPEGDWMRAELSDIRSHIERTASRLADLDSGLVAGGFGHGLAKAMLAVVETQGWSAHEMMRFRAEFSRALDERSTTEDTP